MAKKRFPSDANKQKEKPVKPAPAVEQSGSVPVSAEAPKLVALHYKGKNQVHLDHVYHLAPGLNHLPEELLEKMSNHPVVKHLVESKLLLPADEDGNPIDPEAEDNADEGDDAPPADPAAPTDPADPADPDAEEDEQE